MACRIYGETDIIGFSPTRRVGRELAGIRQSPRLEAIGTEKLKKTGRSWSVDHPGISEYDLLVLRKPRSWSDWTPAHVRGGRKKKKDTWIDRRSRIRRNARDEEL